MWTDAILRGTEMSRTTDGVKGVEKLSTNIKMIVNSGGNTLINQHGDSNWTDRVLRDDTKCHGDTTVMLAIQKAVEPQFEQKSSFEICRLIAAKMGIEEKFTEGRSQFEWVKWCYEESRKKIPGLPDFETFWKQGMAKLWGVRKDPIALEAFRKDPVKNKLKTPSGKIEIYSEQLAKRVADWKLPKGDVISPIPVFWRSWEMPGDALQKKYPLQCFGFHGHGRIHSTFHNLPQLRSIHPDSVWINTIDAAQRKIKEGDLVEIFNDRGIVRLPARVTSRIMPGVVTMPQGAWYKPVEINGKRVDIGGNINTLTHHRPSPLAKGNAQHTILVDVRKAA